MLTYLHVKNLAVIKDVEIHFEPRLNVLSGETGAGKSVLLSSILLALGGRADTESIREGEESAFVELIFKTENKENLTKLEELGIFPENGELILNRRVMEHKSVSKINGETVPLSVLKQVAELFIDVYGQHDAKNLLSPENHLKLLDEYGKEEMREAYTAYRDAYSEYRKKKEESSALLESDEERTRRMDYLKFSIDDIEEAALKPGEEETLRDRLKRLREKEKIDGAVQAACDALDGNGGISEAIQEIRAIVKLAPELEGEYRLLQDAESLVADAKSVLLKHLSQDEEAASGEVIEERLKKIQECKFKYGETVETILEKQAAFSEELEHLNRLTENKDRLLSELEAAKRKLISQAALLHENRVRVAQRFESEMTENLSDMNFLKVDFSVRIEETNRFSKTGRDSVEFYLSVNPGTPLRPLASSASGGELSRIMLSMKTLLHGDEGESEKVLLFDEIDAGISGKTAVAVGRKLRRISAGNQVLLVSHSPQVVASSDAHFLIAKETDGVKTETFVRRLDETGSERELARLLGTGELTESSVENAREMKLFMKSYEK